MKFFNTMLVALLAVVSIPPSAIAPAFAQDKEQAPELQNIARQRVLDFAPFEQALGSYPAEKLSALDAFLPKASISEVQAVMATGDLLSEDLTLYFLSRIKRHDGALRSYLELNPKALEEARAADTLRAAGTVLGPLHGIPVSLKDNIETAGPMHTTANAEILLDNIAQDDAPLVAQLRDAGAVILGKASLSEFAGVVSHGLLLGGSGAVGGQGMNPYGAYPTAGSSSGSAISAAAYLAMISVGTETSGSLIAPAAFNGVVGMKPSRDVVSGDGVIPLVRNNDSAGPIARTVSDAAALLDAIDTKSEDYLSGLKFNALDGVTVGVLSRDITQTPGNAPLLQAAVATLVAAGARLRPAELVDKSGVMAGMNGLVGAGVRHDMMSYLAARDLGVTNPEELIAYNAAEPERRIPFGQPLLENMASASAGIDADAYAEMAVTLTQAAESALEAAFAGVEAEVLVSFENLHSQFYATAGYPAITVPLGRRQSGGTAAVLGLEDQRMPAGITLIGKRGEDGKLLAYAFAFEQASHLRLDPALE